MTFEERLHKALNSKKWDNLDTDVPDGYGMFSEHLLEGADEAGDTSLAVRLDHQMSGYQGSFNCRDLEVDLAEVSETKYEVTFATEDFGGSLPGYYQRQLDNGEMEWSQVFEDYDELRSWGDEEPTVWTKEFDTLVDALDAIDEQVGPYEG